MNSPTNILAVDTSTDACVVALRTGDRLEERFGNTPRQHNLKLLPFVEELLAKAGLAPRDLHLLVFGRGPGSFTGIRIATGVVQGLAYGLALPVAPVSTLACLAQGRLRTSGAPRIAVAMHARNEEIYWGCFERDGDVVRAVGEERLIDCAEARLSLSGPWVGVGDGWRHRDLLENAVGESMSAVDREALPRGCDLLALGLHEHREGRSVGAAHATPVYLREKVAAKGSTRR